MTTASDAPPTPPFAQTREFWVLMGYAVGLGVFGACVGLVFMGVIDRGGDWYVDSDPGWFGGRWWWVAVTAAAGLVVGVVRHLTRLPEQIPSLVADLEAEEVDSRLAPGIVAGFAGSVICGAHPGPPQGARPAPGG